MNKLRLPTVLLVAVAAGCEAQNQLSCSSPAVIETMVAVGYAKNNTEYAITNTGPLGMTGNVLICSGDWNTTANHRRWLRASRSALEAFSCYRADRPVSFEGPSTQP
jgi:hypothetical protein